MNKKQLLILLLIILFIINFNIKENYSNNKIYPRIIWGKIWNIYNLEKKDIFFITDKNYRNYVSKLENYNKKFKVISLFGDITFPEDKRYKNIKKNFFDKVYKNNNLVSWYCINYNFNKKYKKIKHLPLGLDFHTMSLGNKWGGKKTTELEQEKMIIKIYNNSLPFKQRLNKCFLCSNNNTSKSLKNNKYIKYDRSELNNLLKKNKLVDICNSSSREVFWNTIIKYKFIICPAGNGLDTHRLWEALFLGSVTIVQKTGLDPLMKEFPVIIIDNFNDITEENLNIWSIKYGKLCNNPNIRKKYYSKYWLDKILTE